MKKHNKSILLKNADYIITLNEKREILRNASILIKGNQITEIPTKIEKADEVINAQGMIVFPGFINTHLHIPQVFHRHSPGQQNQSIAQWINITTMINREIIPEAMYYGALVCYAELMLSGVTTCFDYFYPFVKGQDGTFEASLKAADDIGVRSTNIRGSMSLSKKYGTLYDEDVVEKSDKILTHSEEMINKYHDNSKYALRRIGIGPCLPYASVEKDYEEAAKLARKHKGVIMATHAAESIWEVEYCKKKFGVSPIGLMKRTGFLGPDVNLTHCNIITKDEIKFIGQTKTNVIITPICNTRDVCDGNGIAPMTELVKAGANLSIGVDGAASNDSANIQDEMRYFRVVSQAKEGLFWHRDEDQSKYTYLNPMDVLSVTCLGGAKTLNRDDIGSLEKGKAADIVIFDPDKEISHAGAINKWGAIMSCNSIRPKYSFINGEKVVEDGQLTKMDQADLNKNFRKFHKVLVANAQKNLDMDIINY